MAWELAGASPHLKVILSRSFLAELSALHAAAAGGVGRWQQTIRLELLDSACANGVRTKVESTACCFEASAYIWVIGGFLDGVN